MFDVWRDFKVFIYRVGTESRLVAVKEFLRMYRRMLWDGWILECVDSIELIHVPGMGYHILVRLGNEAFVRYGFFERLKGLATPRVVALPPDEVVDVLSAVALGKYERVATHELG